MAKEGFASGFECKLHGTREMIEAAVIAFARRKRLDQFRMSAERGKYRGGQPIITVRAEALESNAGGSIGIIEFLDAPGGVVWMKIPPYRGSDAPNAWKPDDQGVVLAEFLTQLMEELQRLGFARQTVQGEAARRLASAREQVAVANDPESVVAMANVLRSALIALADEVYSPEMQPEDEEIPKGDDAVAKLKHFVNYRLSTVSSRYRGALSKAIDAAWELTAALVHRKTPNRNDAETAADLVEAVSQAIARLNPAND